MNVYERMTEHQHQVELFAWAAVARAHGLSVAREWLQRAPEALRRGAPNKEASKPDERLRWLHSVPNGAAYGKDPAQRQKEGARMKAEGLRPGVADVFLPLPMSLACGQGWSAGLYLELKRVKGGTVSAEQKAFGQYANSVGYRWLVVRGYYEAITAIEAYLRGE